MGRGSCDGLSFCFASVATSQKVLTCNRGRRRLQPYVPEGCKLLDARFGDHGCTSNGCTYVLVTSQSLPSYYACSKPAVVSRLPPKMMSEEESMAHAVCPASAQPGCRGTGMKGLPLMAE